jgi:hypothetical protein
MFNNDVEWPENLIELPNSDPVLGSQDDQACPVYPVYSRMIVNGSGNILLTSDLLRIFQVFSQCLVSKSQSPTM